MIVLLAGAALAAAGCAADDSGEQVSFDTWDGDPDWSPDGRLIAFATSRGGGGLALIHPDGTQLRSLVRGDAGDPDWAPDGRRLAFVRPDGIYVLKLAGGSSRRVVAGKELSWPAWSPDGSRIAFVREEPDFSSSIYVAPAGGGRATRLLPRFRGAVGDARPGSPGALSEREPAWSPSGREIAFQAGDGELVVATVPDGARRTIATGAAAYEPAWSPDGRLVAFQCEGSLCVARSDGSGHTKTVASDGGDPSWAPGSQRVVYEHYLYGGTGYFSRPGSLSTIDADGGHRERLTFGPDVPPSSG